MFGQRVFIAVQAFQLFTVEQGYFLKLQCLCFSLQWFLSEQSRGSVPLATV